ncbi:MAG: hypothetical protein AYK19_20435 [Theionarchaea archaeon DG-70-1]|nr:MAG: hypothetical protein AYK19_20435 [Theionarchaea archaeon DG-70-1]
MYLFLTVGFYSFPMRHQKIIEGFIEGSFLYFMEVLDSSFGSGSLVQLKCIISLEKLSFFILLLINYKKFNLFNFLHIFLIYFRFIIQITLKNSFSIVVVFLRMATINLKYYIDFEK